MWSCDSIVTRILNCCCAPLIIWVPTEVKNSLLPRLLWWEELQPVSSFLCFLSEDLSQMSPRTEEMFSEVSVWSTNSPESKEVFTILSRLTKNSSKLSSNWRYLAIVLLFFKWLMWWICCCCWLINLSLRPSCVQIVYIFLWVSDCCSYKTRNMKMWDLKNVFSN